MKRKLYTVKLRVSQEQLEAHFVLDSPGFVIAKEALKAGEIATSLEVLETICLANQLYADVLMIRMVEALKPYSKGAEYLEKRGSEDIGDFVVGILGKAKALQIMRDAMDEVRRESKIGTGENDQATTKKKERRKGRSHS